MSRTTTLIASLLAVASATAFAHEPSTATASATPDASESMQGHSMPMSGDADLDFAMMMRDHHKMALPMAQKELKNGKDRAMRRMAQHILDGQTKEIADFDRWLAAHKKSR